MESNREQMVTAALSKRPIGRLCETNHGYTGESSRTLSRSGNDTSSHGTGVKPPEQLAVQHTNRTASALSKTKQKPSSTVTLSQRQSGEITARAPLNHKQLDRGSEAGRGDDTALAATTADLAERMMHIPAEICQMIMDMVFEAAFGPRRVQPHRDPPILNVFLALDRKFYRRFHEQYWTKNTWVVSKGPLNETMRFMTAKPYNETTTLFSLQIPNQAALQIQSAQLSFSNADTPDLPEWIRLTERTPTRYATAMPSSSPFAARRSHDYRRCDEIQRQLLQTWSDKFDRVAMMDLRHLTLDFTEAYDPSGLYLGVLLVRRLIKFDNGMPDDFRVSAPDSRIERQIRNAFIALNAG